MFFLLINFKVIIVKHIWRVQIWVDCSDNVVISDTIWFIYFIYQGPFGLCLHSSHLLYITILNISFLLLTRFIMLISINSNHSINSSVTSPPEIPHFNWALAIWLMKLILNVLSKSAHVSIRLLRWIHTSQEQCILILPLYLIVAFKFFNIISIVPILRKHRDSSSLWIITISYPWRVILDIEVKSLIVCLLVVIKLYTLVTLFIIHSKLKHISLNFILLLINLITISSGKKWISWKYWIVIIRVIIVIVVIVLIWSIS